MKDVPLIEYLTRWLIAEHGFWEGTLPEARELLDAADIVLTAVNGFGCVIVCLMDRERDATRRFPLEPEVLRRVGTACQMNTSHLHAATPRVVLHVIEVGWGPLSDEDRARLKRYTHPLFSKVHLSATYVDAFMQEAWNNHRIRLTAPGTFLLRRLLREPQRELVPQAPEPVAPLPDRVPWLTFVLLTLLVLVFCAEQHFSLGNEAHGLLEPNMRTLRSFGGLHWGAVVDEGQGWRLLTAPLLHGDLVHLLINGFCLFFAAVVVEAIVGSAWMGLLFIVSALGGGLMSLAVNSYDLVSVGASGAIMGLLAASIPLGIHLTQEDTQWESLMAALSVVLTLLPLVIYEGGFGAPLGGALVGGLHGWGLRRQWRKQEPRPPARWLAGALGLLTVLALGAALGPLSRVYTEARSETLSSPPRALAPHGSAGLSSRALDASTRGRDPHNPGTALATLATLATYSNLNKGASHAQKTFELSAYKGQTILFSDAPAEPTIPRMTKTMRVFVTGATGWIGTAVLKELRGAGHSVLGMAHSDAGADKLKAQGVEVYRGDLRDPQCLVEGVRATDATIHLAFHMDFSDFAKINQIDRDAIRAMLDAMAGTNKAFVGTNGTLVVANSGKVALETDASPPTNSPLAVRLQAERLVVDAAKRGVRGSVIRLAPTVHGAGDKGFIAMLTQLAREKKSAGYIDEGHQHWPAVHRDDAARLYRLAVESAPPGTVLHGTAEEGITMRAIAETISQGTGVPAKSVPAAEAGAHFGWLSMAVGLDNRASSQATRELLGWKPQQPDLLDDMRAHYFERPSAGGASGAGRTPG